MRYPAAIIDRIRDMAHHLPDAEIADQLRQEGHASITGKPYTKKIIQWIQVAKHFGVSNGVVYYWIQHAQLQARKLHTGSPYWVTLNETEEQKLREWVRNSSRIHTASPTHAEGGAL